MNRLAPHVWSVIALCIVLGGAAVLRNARGPDASLFTLSSGFGPTAEALVTHGTLATSNKLSDLQIQGVEGHVLTFGAARRPLIPVFLAAVASVWNHRALAALVKSLLILPFLAVALATLLGSIEARRRRLLIPLLLVACLIPSHLSQLTVLDVEEAYSIPLLLLLVTATFIAALERRELFPTLSPIAAALLILTKSSLPTPVIALAALQCLYLRRRSMLTRYAVAIVGSLLLVASVNAIFSGRFTTASSIDWWNAYKGNNEQTAHYYGSSRLDDLPIATTPLFRSEWEFSDYFRAQTLAFVRAHPAEALKLAGLKAWNFFGRIDFVSGSIAPGGMTWKVWLLMNAFLRLLLLSALGLAFIGVLRFRTEGSRSPRARLSLAYLLLVATTALPHVAGFAYLRHVMPLVLPTVCFLGLRLFHPAIGKASAMRSAGR